MIEGSSHPTTLSVLIHSTFTCLWVQVIWLTEGMRGRSDGCGGSSRFCLKGLTFSLSSFVGCWVCRISYLGR